VWNFAFWNEKAIFKMLQIQILLFGKSLSCSIKH
jgi:hypothetical protein